MAKKKKKAQKKSNKLWCVDRRQKVLLRDELATRGEGSVYRCNLQHYLAKIYREPEKQDFKKLRYMISHPPRDPTKSSRGHISIAWPEDLLMAHNGKPVGFIMPFIRKGLPLVKIYNPSHRKKCAPGFNWKYLHVTAYNVALIVEALHEIGYVVGDIQSQNMLVNPQAMVSIIDTDSFQVKIESGKIYRCPVGASGFTPPELLGKNLRDHDRNKYHDCFGMAVLIHQLLMGYHPYSGKWTGDDQPLGIDDFIRLGDWVGDTKGKLQRGRWCVPQKIIDSRLQVLFYRAFTEGHDDPRRRPEPKEWREVLKEVIDELRQCEHVKNHFYSGDKPCCWACEWQSSMSSGKPNLDHAIKSRAEVGAISLPKPQPAQPMKKAQKVNGPKTLEDNKGKKTKAAPAPAREAAPAKARKPPSPPKPWRERLAPLLAPFRFLKKLLPTRWYTWFLTIALIGSAGAFYAYYPASLVFVKGLPTHFQQKVVKPMKPHFVALKDKLFPPPLSARESGQAYFENLARGDFQGAWDGLTKRCKGSLARKRMGLKQYRAFWQKRLPIKVVASSVKKENEQAAIVKVTIETTKERVPRAYLLRLAYDEDRALWFIDKQKKL